MKLLSISLARVIWNVHVKDLNPRGLSLGMPVVKTLVDKYKFTDFPQTHEQMDEKKGIHFREGTFTVDTGEKILIALSVYEWGFVADTRSSTQHSEAFLREFLGTVVANFKLPPYEEIIRSKSYVSEVYVRTDTSMDALNPRLAAFSKKLSTLVKGHETVSYGTAGIAFWNDPSLNLAFPFRFERQENVGFKENRYYSVAPLETDTHLALLEELESILGNY